MGADEGGRTERDADDDDAVGRQWNAELAERCEVLR
jgi:hypothetical protein